MNEATPATPAEPTLAEQYNTWAPLIIEVNGEFITRTAHEVEYVFRNLDSYRSIANTQTSNIDSVKDYLIENYEELGDHADHIASLLDIELEREVTYSVSMSCSVTVTVKCGEDGEDLITENLYIDSSDGNISIDDYNVDTVYEA
jgi:porphobilinogen deaminase